MLCISGYSFSKNFQHRVGKTLLALSRIRLNINTNMLRKNNQTFPQTAPHQFAPLLNSLEHECVLYVS